MDEIWNQARIEQYIADGIEESLNLDYKAADALSNGKNNEITKDVSAMANSAGGLLIYGISEYKDSARKHLPEKIDPIDRTKFSKEKLEHVISNIQPKIDGIMIHPISIATAPTHVVYVVEIPQSHTAHQSGYKKYYKRYNFESVAMDDYEIRDVMGRGQYPHIELEFETVITEEEIYKGGIGYMGVMHYDSGKPIEKEIVTQYQLRTWAFNSGTLYAQFVNIYIRIPDILLPPQPDDKGRYFKRRKRRTEDIEGTLFYSHYDDNTTRDYIGSTNGNANYGTARHVPILPKRYFKLEDVEFRTDFDEQSLENLYIHWEVYADNAPILKGKTAVVDFKLIDRRNETEDE